MAATGSTWVLHLPLFLLMRQELGVSCILAHFSARVLLLCTLGTFPPFGLLEKGHQHLCTPDSFSAVAAAHPTGPPGPLLVAVA